MPVQQSDAAQRRRVAGLAAFIRTMVVLQCFTAFQTDADREVMFPEQAAPRIVDERGVGLQAVADGDARGGIALLQRQRLLIKPQSGQQRFAALPDEINLPGPGRLGGNLAADKRLQRRIVHFPHRGIALWVITVTAGKVAGRTNGFDQKMKGHRCPRLHSQRNLLLA